MTPHEPTAVDFVGQGELPEELDGVNFGAYGFGCIWGFLYGPRAWLLGMISAFVIPILIDSVALLFYSRTVFQTVASVTGVATGLTWSVLLAVYALRVNCLVWDRERSFFEADPDGPQFPIPYRRYRKSVRFWTKLFVAALGMGAIASVAAAAGGRIGWRDLVPGWSAAPLVGLFIYDRVRRRAHTRRTRVSS